MVSDSFLEIGYLKATLILAVVGLNVCEFYMKYERIGKFLLIIAKVFRKLYRHEEAI
jgi:hypothetical protein